AAQAEAEAVSRSIAVGHCELDVGDARSLVFEGESQALSGALLESLQTHRSATTVIHGVAGQFARCRHDLGLVHQTQPLRDGPCTNRLTNRHDVLRATYFHHLSPEDGHPTPLNRPEICRPARLGSSLR